MTDHRSKMIESSKLFEPSVSVATIENIEYRLGDILSVKKSYYPFERGDTTTILAMENAGDRIILTLSHNSVHGRYSDRHSDGNWAINNFNLIKVFEKISNIECICLRCINSCKDFDKKECPFFIRREKDDV